MKFLTKLLTCLVLVVLTAIYYIVFVPVLYFLGARGLSDKYYDFLESVVDFIE